MEKCHTTIFISFLFWKPDEYRTAQFAGERDWGVWEGQIMAFREDLTDLTFHLLWPEAVIRKDFFKDLENWDALFFFWIMRCNKHLICCVFGRIFLWILKDFQGFFWRIQILCLNSFYWSFYVKLVVIYDSTQLLWVVYTCSHRQHIGFALLSLISVEDEKNWASMVIRWLSAPSKCQNPFLIY